MKKVLMIAFAAALMLCGCGQTPQDYVKENFYDLYSKYNVIKDGVYIVENDGVFSVVNSLTGDVYVDGGYSRMEKLNETKLLAANGMAYSIISPNGEMLVDLGEYENIRLYKNGDEPRLLTYNAGYYTLLDQNGDVIGDYGEFDHLELNTKTNDRFVIQRGTLYTVINEQGNQIANLGRFEQLVPVFENDAYIVLRNGKKGVINNNGAFIIQPSYHDIWCMNKNGCYAVNVDDSFGVADKNGRVIIPVKYDGIEGYKMAFVAVKDGLYGVFDSNGKEVLPCEYEKTDKISETETEFSACFVKNGAEYTVTVGKDGVIKQ